MKKVLIITPEYFLDVDLKLVALLNQEFDLEWRVVWGKKQLNRYKTDEINDYVKRNNIKYENINLNYRCRNLKVIKDYNKMLKGHKKFDVIYSSFIGHPYFMLYFPLITNIRKVIVAIHDVKPHKGSSRIEHVSALLFPLFFKTFHLFSQNQANYFKSIYKNKKVSVIPMFLKDFGKAAFNTNPLEKVKFLFFGIERYNKGLDILLKACENINNKFENFELTIAGKFIDKSKYEIFFNNFNDKTLIIDDRVIPSKEIPLLFSKSDYIILPYRDVTQSGPLFIAMNYHLPAIVSNHHGFTEYIKDGYNGFIFENESVESLQNVICSILMNKPSCNQIIKENMKNYIETTYSQERILNKYCELINSI